MTQTTDSPSTTATILPTPGICWWCDSTEDVQEIVNGWDNGALLYLCAACIGPEPDACAEHRSGCNGHEHTHTAEAL